MDLWEQLQAARADDHHEEKRKTEELRDLRNQEIEAELPHPQCCDSAKKYIYPYREIDHREEVLNDGRPVWKNSFPVQWGSSEGCRDFVVMHFCPFCGTKLPGLRKKKDPPPHLIIEKDYHCGRCGQRFGRMGYCFCSLPESAWEIDA